LRICLGGGRRRSSGRRRTGPACGLPAPTDAVSRPSEFAHYAVVSRPEPPESLIDSWPGRSYARLESGSAARPSRSEER
jgi:hypothetical protein